VFANVRRYRRCFGLLASGKHGGRAKEGAMAIELAFDTAARDGWEVLAVRGEIDAYTSPRLRERLTQLMEDGHYRVVVDLEGVEFMDSTGLGVLVSCLKRSREHQGDVALVCTAPQILRVLAITGLDRVFVVRESIEDITSPA
jgi:anti-sigma B factor antagonist